MNVAVIASEAVPFAKTGGLADVAGTLPIALDRLGIKASLFLPFYREARRSGLSPQETGVTLHVPAGARIVEGKVLTCKLPGSRADAFLIDQPGYFDREGLYQRDGADHPDNCERFAFFARATLEAIRLLDLRPDVLHGNDWQTGLIPVLLEESYRNRPGFGAMGTLLSVHNLAYQGSFGPQALPSTGIEPRMLDGFHLEGDGRLNFLKIGLASADLLNTVSPTYAREIQTPEYGCGLDGLLRSRSADLFGIINGIDESTWDPATDRDLAARYDSATVEAGKAACKADLQRLAGLPGRPGVPLLAQIGRLARQKGWDLLAAVADDLLREDVQMVVLGTGDPAYHDLLGRLEAAHPGKLRAFVGFSDPLAHRIEAGADLFLMPSLYEPCGLNQLYSQAYGTVPVVRATGGLADTVVDANPATLADGTATGITFRDPSPEALRGAIDRALALRGDREAWSKVVLAGMRADWSWGRGARAYAELYEEVRRRRTSRAAG